MFPYTYILLIAHRKNYVYENIRISLVSLSVNFINA